MSSGRSSEDLPRYLPLQKYVPPWESSYEDSIQDLSFENIPDKLHVPISIALSLVDAAIIKYPIRKYEKFAIDRTLVMGIQTYEEDAPAFPPDTDLLHKRMAVYHLSCSFAAWMASELLKKCLLDTRYSVEMNTIYVREPKWAFIPLFSEDDEEGKNLRTPEHAIVRIYGVTESIELVLDPSIAQFGEDMSQRLSIAGDLDPPYEPVSEKDKTEIISILDENEYWNPGRRILMSTLEETIEKKMNDLKDSGISNQGAPETGSGTTTYGITPADINSMIKSIQEQLDPFAYL